MHSYAFKKDEVSYKAKYRTYEGAIILLRITEIDNPSRELELAQLFYNETEQGKFIRALKIHALRYLGC
tara:strand:+ start:80 stop:286 length:207 start_codon:yes stop_codon:yes gene_type:complete